MKKHPCISKVIIVLILFPLLLSCNKLWDAIRPSGPNTPPGFQLKEMIFSDQTNYDRHYLFYYNIYKELDSIRRVDARDDGSVFYTNVYQVTYKSTGRIDSVKLYESGGVLVTSGSDYEYDYHGRITRYNYKFWLEEESPLIPIFYSYKNDMVIHGVIMPNAAKDTIFYNLQQNATNWYRSSWKTAYTYDGQLNPLFYVKHLSKIALEDGQFYEYGMSKHNMATSVIQRPPQGDLSITYENIYDNHHRIIEKRFIDEQQQVFKFKYY